LVTSRPAAISDSPMGPIGQASFLKLSQV